MPRIAWTQLRLETLGFLIRDKQFSFGYSISGNDGFSIYSPEETLGVKQANKAVGELSEPTNPTGVEITILLLNTGNDNAEVIVYNGFGQAVISKQLAATTVKLQTLVEHPVFWHPFDYS